MRRFIVIAFVLAVCGVSASVDSDAQNVSLTGRIPDTVRVSNLNIVIDFNSDHVFKRFVLATKHYDSNLVHISTYLMSFVATISTPVPKTSLITTSPINIGDVVIKNILGTGVDIVATKNILR